MTLRASILVADDDETSARFLKRLLTKEGHDVSVVHAPDDAVSHCQDDPPDMVLVDLVAPRGYGFEVCRRIKEDPRTRLIPVVIVTSADMPGRRPAGGRRGGRRSPAAAA